MGIRNSLEEIRFGNVESYDSHAVERRPDRMPGTAAGGSPWVTIWFQPRATIRRIIHVEPSYYIHTIAFIVGMAQALILASLFHLGDRYEFSTVVIGCLTLGPLFGLTSISIGGFCFHRGAKMLGSPCRLDEVQAALAWGSVPSGVVLLGTLSSVIFVGSPMFMSHNWMNKDPLDQSLGTIYLIEAIMLIWSIVLISSCLREVTGLSLGKLPLAIVVGAVFYAILIIPPAFLLNFACQFLTREMFPANPPTAWNGKQAMPPLPARNNPLYTAKALSKEIAAIESQGYKLVVNNGSPDTSLTVDTLEITQLTRPPGFTTTSTLSNLELMISVTDLRIAPDKQLGAGGRLWAPEVASIARLPYLRKLDLSKMNIRGDRLNDLKPLTMLEELKLSECRLQALSTHILFFNFRSLHTLWLDHNTLNDGFLMTLGQIPSLRVLHLESTGLTDKALLNLTGFRGVTNLDELYLGDNPKLTAQSIGTLTNFPGLLHLDLSRTSLGDADIQTISTLSTVNTIDLRGTSLSAKGIATLKIEMPSTTILWDKPAASNSK